MKKVRDSQSTMHGDLRVRSNSDACPDEFGQGSARDPPHPAPFGTILACYSTVFRELRVEIEGAALEVSPYHSAAIERKGHEGSLRRDRVCASLVC